MYERPHDPWAALALAVILQAAEDTQMGYPALAAEARAWLLMVGLGWCQALDVPDDALKQWVKTGFQLSDNSHRNWRYWGNS
ncbi:MAG: hypothetical protein GX491_05325 [Chloroflexi bacterium]|jgi:hypothetical protein|nr:hypothetical protein [Chloroflexota bacterium]